MAPSPTYAEYVAAQTKHDAARPAVDKLVGMYAAGLLDAVDLANELLDVIAEYGLGR